ncbi:bifunctional diguanylate cyclase/phosphodiesterase [Novosphingobium sp. PS1R-30]|uniref:Bifunctional diguanylate cyclase/phosphodiesterase n=1 Tax=Novosphingobium anseongense TaxID=3133436 RepID=A0ABU8S1T4_9SPHN
MPFEIERAPDKRSSHSSVSEREALNYLSSAVLLVDEDGIVRFANMQSRDLFACEAHPGVALSTLLQTRVVSGMIDLAGPKGTGCDTSLRFTDGRSVWAAARPVPSGGWSIVFQDVRMALAQAETTDPVTLLANRACLSSTLTAAIGAACDPVLFAVGLDRFRHVKDALGHEIGDALLRRVAERLTSLADSCDLAARVGDGEFLLLKARAMDAGETTALADRIVDLLSRTYAVEGQMLNVVAHVGVAMACREIATPEDYIKRADLALAQARSDGVGVRFYEPVLAERMEVRRRLELDLRRALALKQFELAYQPQIHLESGTIGGFEALLRWRQADGSFVSPADFIPIAEETGLILPIGEWVLRSACQAAAHWSHPAVVAVNLSPVQFRNRGLTQNVVAALAHAGLPPERLELEITEGALLEDTEAVIATLKSLRSLGVKVSMDDFGTGYSSLSYLRKFPFDKIKIDQSFVRELEHDAEARAIVRTIAALGSSLGIKITAEGVETQGQLEEVRSHGCDYVQGYLTGRPMDDAAARASLARIEDRVHGT